MKICETFFLIIFEIGNRKIEENQKEEEEIKREKQSVSDQKQ